MELNKIYNEDCLIGMQSIPDGYVDLVVTSPPYDNLRTYNNNIDKTWGEHIWKPVIAELYRVIKDGGVVVWIVNDATIKGSETGTSFRQALYAMACGFKLHDTMIWQKSTFTDTGSLVTRYGNVFEYMFIFSKNKPKTFNPLKDRANVSAGRKNHGTVIQRDGSVRPISGVGKKITTFGQRFNIWKIEPCKSNAERTGHPAQFPLRLAKDHIRSWSNEGDIILDPFMGSGTTAIACIREHRNFIGFEMSKEYYDKANQRIQNELAQPTLF